MKKRNLKPPQLLSYLVPFQTAGMLIGLVAATATAPSSGSFVSLNGPGSVSVFFGFSLIGLVSGIVIWAAAFNRFVKDPDIVRNRKERIERARRKIRMRIQASDKAQLEKKEFDERLQQFLGGCNLADRNVEPFESKMPYWQSTSFGFGNGKMPKPIEAIRELLMRIHRLIRSNSG